MLYTSSFFIAVAITAVSASPLQPREKTLSFQLGHVANATSLRSIVDRGTSRINRINAGNEDGYFEVDASSPITNEVVSYVAPVTISGTTYDLIVDTGSSNLWTGARGFTKATSSDTGNTVSVGYGSGQFSGEEYIGTVTLGGLTVSKQSFGGASSASGFNGVDGILGLGPVGLTKNTVSNTNLVPTFLDNLYSQGSIATEVIGVSFRPESGSDNDDVNGELTLGGIDSSKYSGSITYFPTLKTGAASSYWGISVSGFSYGSTSLGSGTGIVDTGTTLIYLPTAVYNKFLSASGASASDSASVGLATYSKKPTANFQITIGSTVFTLTPSQYLIPKEQYSQLGISSSSNKYYAWISDGGRTGVNTIIGQKFLEYYYSVYDTTNARIGFAPAI